MTLSWQWFQGGKHKNWYYKKIKLGSDYHQAKLALATDACPVLHTDQYSHSHGSVSVTSTH